MKEQWTELDFSEEYPGIILYNARIGNQTWLRNPCLHPRISENQMEVFYNDRIKWGSFQQDQQAIFEVSRCQILYVTVS